MKFLRFIKNLLTQIGIFLCGMGLFALLVTVIFLFLGSALVLLGIDFSIDAPNSFLYIIENGSGAFMVVGFFISFSFMIKEIYKEIKKVWNNS